MKRERTDIEIQTVINNMESEIDSLIEDFPKHKKTQEGSSVLATASRLNYIVFSLGEIIKCEQIPEELIDHFHQCDDDECLMHHLFGWCLGQEMPIISDYEYITGR